MERRAEADARLENARLDHQGCEKRGELVDCRYCSCPDCTTPRCNALPDSPHPRHRTLANHMANHMATHTVLGGARRERATYACRSAQ